VTWTPTCPVQRGFLEGIAETGDALEATIRGTIAALFAVEPWGAFGMMEAGKAKALERRD
jgi:hypothetical protein